MIFAVVSIITKDDKVLIGKLKQAKLKSFGGLEYIFPGGKLEDREGFEDAVLREVKEETGLDVEILAKVGERDHPSTNNKIFYFHCEVIGGEENVSSPKNDDIEELMWVPIEKLREYMPTLFPDVEKYLDDKKHDGTSDLSE